MTKAYLEHCSGGPTRLVRRGEKGINKRETEENYHYFTSSALLTCQTFKKKCTYNLELEK